MSHYGIVKRQRYWIKPEWKEVVRVSSHSYDFLNIYSTAYRTKTLKFENRDFEFFGVRYENIIHEVLEKGLIITYWEGEVKQAPLNIGETMVIDDEKFTISKVEKDVDGVVTYYVDDLVLESEDYNELLAGCEKKYEEYSKELKRETEEYQRLRELEKVNENPFTDPKQIKSRWKRIFKLT